MYGYCSLVARSSTVPHLFCLIYAFYSMRIFVGSTGLPMPGRPKPLYSFFPIYSPFKVNDDDGFNMGEDNRIKSIEIKDGALQFEVSFAFH